MLFSNEWWIGFEKKNRMCHIVSIHKKNPLIYLCKFPIHIVVVCLKNDGYTHIIVFHECIVYIVNKMDFTAFFRWTMLSDFIIILDFIMWKLRKSPVLVFFRCWVAIWKNNVTTKQNELMAQTQRKQTDRWKPLSFFFFFWW